MKCVVMMKRETMKQKEAVERQEAWAALKPAQKFAALDRRLGKDVGAVKQRVKLLAESSLDEALIYALTHGAGPKILEILRKRMKNE